jgi:hypothetical protein
MAANPLYDWLKARKLWAQGPEDHRTITHFFMDGGKAHVPDDCVDEFVERYCEALRAGHKQYAVESRTPLFKLFMDVDLQSRSPVEDEAVMKICAVIRAASLEFFDSMESNVIVCVCPERSLGGGFKRGVHVHWTNVFVSSSKALTFRNLVLKQVTEAFGECYMVPWSKILDMTVYKSSGLRMIGASKVDAPGEYWPWRMFTKDGSLVDVQDPRVRMEEWVASTSIRTRFSTTAPVSDTTDQRGEEKILKADYKGDVSHLNIQEHSESISEVLRLVSSIKDSRGNAFYKKFRATSLYRIKDGTHLTFIMGTSCKSCMNKVNGVHRSNHVYFLLNDAGLFQKCFCRCETTEGRKFKMCKDFKFRLTPKLPPVVLQKLFGKQPASAANGKDRAKTQLENILKRY